jgi:hypothetical protein
MERSCLRFDALTPRELHVLESDLLPRLDSGAEGSAIICSREFGTESVTRFEQHKKAISYGCTVAVALESTCVVVICDYSFKAAWIRSNIHARRGGGGVLSHPEFAILWRETQEPKPAHELNLGITDRDLEEILLGNFPSRRTLFIVQGKPTQAARSLGFISHLVKKTKLLVLEDSEL